MVHFYPRPPRGGRLCKLLNPADGYVISIHALREEGDFSPLGGVEKWLISIHALREEGDVTFTVKNVPADISIHALREEGDSTAWMEQSDTEIFLSTPSARRATASCWMRL